MHFVRWGTVCRTHGGVGRKQELSLYSVVITMTATVFIRTTSATLNADRTLSLPSYSVETLCGPHPESNDGPHLTTNLLRTYGTYDRGGLG